MVVILNLPKAGVRDYEDSRSRSNHSTIWYMARLRYSTDDKVIAHSANGIAHFSAR